MKIYIFISLILFIANPIYAQQSNGKIVHEETKNPSNKAATLPVDLYQKHLSPILGGKCPMYPSCSHYSKDAINKHGLLMGWFMTCDRLMRCGRDELDRSEIVKVHQQELCYDPVSNNDFWLK